VEGGAFFSRATPDAELQAEQEVDDPQLWALQGVSWNDGFQGHVLIGVARQ